MRDSVVSSCDAAELFELADGALDTVSQFVDGGIEGALSGHAGSLRDDGFCAAGLDMVEDDMAVISLVGDDMLGRKAGHQRDGGVVIAGIATGQDEAHRAAKAVDRNVPLAGQPSSGAPQSLIATPPF